MSNSERIEAYAQAVQGIIGAEGHSAEAEDELFRIARTIEGNDALRSTLADAAIPVAQRMAVIEDLLDGRALAVTKSVTSFIVGSGRAHDFEAIVERVVNLGAAERNHEIAEVRSAITLDGAQQTRLAEALSKATGKQVEVKVIIDPSVMGGIAARVGDVVIDGTVRRKLDQLKEQI